VYHLAANPDIARAAREPDIDFREGTLLTQHVLEAMRINRVSTLVFTSGSGVYGEVPGVSLVEGHGPCKPISTYGASKLACEAMVSAYCHMFGMVGRVFRFANVVGPRQTHGVGYDFVRRLMAAPDHLQILGDGSQRKSYIHVEDVLDAVDVVLANVPSTCPYDVFNVSTWDALTVTAIADLACETLGLDTSRVRYDYTGGDRGWNGDVPTVVLDTTKVRALGWQARRSSREAMSVAMQAMRDEVLR
jgi:UDP-glucose 4-epimerase